MTLPKALLPPKNSRAILVASTGGHLAQAMRWHRRLELHEDSLFVTFDTPQSRSLLRNHQRAIVPYVSPRDFRGIAKTIAALMRIDLHEFDCTISTGAGVALAAAMPSRLNNVPYYFIESVSRFDGPSTSGKILRYVPGVRCRTQHKSWSDRRWKYVGSLLDEYRVLAEPERLLDEEGPRNIFVTLGTIKPYRFDRLVDAVKRVMQPHDTVTWQLGCTTRDDVANQQIQLEKEEFRQLAVDSDVVITHAGVGAILEFLEWGISPIVVPRRKEFGEHVDDHQTQVTTELHRAGLVTHVEPQLLTREAISAPRPRIAHA